jgi:hypothetical protein
LALAVLIPAFVLLFSCSTQPAGPQPGSPEFYWSAAKETTAMGDYVKTTMHLDRLASKENDYTDRAQAWLMVMSAGMAKAYSDMAENFEAGARANRADPLSFRRLANNYRMTAGRLSLQFAQAFDRFSKTTIDPVPLAFGFPKGNPGVPPHLLRVEKGIMPGEADIEAALSASLDRGILLTTCRAAGAPEDTAKASELFRAEKVEVPRGTFMLAMANAFFDQAQLYVRTRLSDPSKLKALCDRGLDALKSAPDSKDSKDLAKKIQALLKKERV